MRFFALAALICLVPPLSSALAKDSAGNAPPTAVPASVLPRSLSAIKLDIHKALRTEATSRRSGPNVAEVVRLIALYREMAAHPKRGHSELLSQMGLQVRGRLQIIREHIGAQTKQRRHKAEISSLASITSPPTVLAQQIPAPNAGGAPGQASPAGLATGARGAVDYGPELVELIQQTISPATWDINGGLGAVVYYPRSRVLVVSAPSHVHPQVGNVLEQLRAAP